MNDKICEDCGKVQQLGEPYWTTKTKHPDYPWKGMVVCADCLYKLDGRDRRGQSVGEALHQLEIQRRKANNK